MNNSEFLRYSHSYAQIVEKYSLLLRKTSMIHPKVMDIYGDEIDKLVKTVDKLLMETEGSNFKVEKLFELRKLIYQIEYIVNFKVIESYNNLVDKVSFPAIETGIPVLQSPAVYMATDTGVERGNIKEPKDIWDSVCAYLKSKLNVHTYNVWVKPVKYHSCDNRMISVWVQNNYYKNWLEEHCAGIINDHLSSNNIDYEVRFITG
jgi:hypothetical protein